jgi:ketosteroid isomerase-like protein
MRPRVCSFLLFVVAYTTTVLPQTQEATIPPGQNQNVGGADISELTRLATVAGRAYANRDLAILEGLTADDYVQTDVRGGVLNRTQWLEFVKNRKSELTVDTDDVHVAVYGVAAVVRGHWTYTRRAAGKPAVTHSQWTSVWTRYPDGWKRHVFQNTYVNANADRCVREPEH